MRSGRRLSLERRLGRSPPLSSSSASFSTCWARRCSRATSPPRRFGVGFLAMASLPARRYASGPLLDPASAYDAAVVLGAESTIQLRAGRIGMLLEVADHLVSLCGHSHDGDHVGALWLGVGGRCGRGVGGFGGGGHRSSRIPAGLGGLGRATGPALAVPGRAAGVFFEVLLR